MNQLTIGEASVVVAGSVEVPQRALILLHGRGGTAEDIMTVMQGLALSPDCVVLAPQAPGNAWYPERFLVPQAENEPALSAALELVADLVAYVQTTYGISEKAVVLAGFSQGACLVAEFLKRAAGRYGGAVIMSGGVIGSDAEAVASTSTSGGGLAGTPVYIGCDREDFHIPVARVEASAAVLETCGAAVTLRLYDGLGHRVHPEALVFLKELLT